MAPFASKEEGKSEYVPSFLAITRHRERSISREASRYGGKVMGCRYCGIHGERCLSSDEASQCHNRSNNVAYSWSPVGWMERPENIALSEIAAAQGDAAAIYAALLKMKASVEQEARNDR